MNSPLKKIRLKRKQTLQAVADAVETDTGNLSRIERGLQVPSKDMAEKLAKHFDNEVTETQIIYPERFMAADESEVQTDYAGASDEPGQATTDCREQKAA